MELTSRQRRCQAGLNTGEARHFLAHVVYVHRQGRITDRLWRLVTRLLGLGQVVANAICSCALPYSSAALSYQLVVCSCRHFGC
jgi:TnpA family transposase